MSTPPQVTRSITSHTGDATDAHDASAVSVVDAANRLTGADVEAVIAELQKLNLTSSSPPTVLELADPNAVFVWAYSGVGVALFANTGTYAVPDWKPLNEITNLLGAGFTANTGGGKQIASAVGDIFEINAGGADKIGADILTGTDDPSLGGNPTTPTPALKLRRPDPGDTTELWYHTGSGDTDWAKFPTEAVLEDRTSFVALAKWGTD